MPLRARSPKLSGRDLPRLFNTAHIGQKGEESPTKTDGVGHAHFPSFLGRDTVRNFVVFNLRHDAPRHHVTGFGKDALQSPGSLLPRLRLAG